VVKSREPGSTQLRLGVTAENSAVDFREVSRLEPLDHGANLDPESSPPPPMTCVAFLSAQDRIRKIRLRTAEASPEFLEGGHGALADEQCANGLALFAFGRRMRCAGG
jgi:hypothetical protein